MSQTAPTCTSCRSIVNLKLQPYTLYPTCSHLFHLTCLIKRENHINVADHCPLCHYKGEDNKLSYQLFEDFKETKRYLSAGVNFKEYKQDLKIAAMENLVVNKYRTHKESMTRIKEKVNTTVRKPKQKTSWSPFDWSFNHSRADSLTTYERRKTFVKQIEDKADIVILVSQKYTMKDAIAENIGVYTLIRNGYTLIDWFLLKAKWSDLLEAGLDAQCFEKYFEVVDIESLIDFYDLNARDIFVNLCESSLDGMAKLRLTVENMKKIEFTPMFAKKMYVTLELIKKSKLWATLTIEEWSRLDFIH